ncbi:hypothetical protein U14_01754 [Candidatus Moduliflexus flocculans]|uniref:DUF3795 domain-containing protein n=1 Tax=Candidatus Moduliflexus flocculans TaxID=1499966 RepID=A0A0S6VSS2_9BACT|nr:hypothetical protein U14_01754 [Candidatus Moduliflexus flocculans]
MEQMIAICGLECQNCGAFLATQQNSEQKRIEVAKEWSQMFHADIKPESINCDGCLATSGRLFQHCMVCELRACGMAKGVENCAQCAEYACEKLGKFFQMAPEARGVLDRVRRADAAS